MGIIVYRISRGEALIDLTTTFKYIPEVRAKNLMKGFPLLECLSNLDLEEIYTELFTNMNLKSPFFSHLSLNKALVEVLDEA